MSFDAIVIGGGHNGLAAAAYLGRAGRRVLVLEQREDLGGLAGVREFHPGYRCSGIWHDASLVRSRVVADLALEKHGLRRRGERTPVLVPSADGPGLVLHGGEDDDGCLQSFVEALRGYMTAFLDQPPPSIAPSTLREHWSLFRKVLGLRRLGQKTMFESLRVGPMSAWDWLEECTGSKPLQAGLVAPALLGTRTGPRAAGTAALLLMHECVVSGDVIGGPAALVEALAAACRERGVEIRTGAMVQRILVAEGRVKGVALDDGDVFESRQVASSVDPRQTFLELLAPRDLPVGLENPMRNWRCRGTSAKVHLALEGPLEFACRPGVFEAASVGEDLVQLERAFDAVKYREIPDAPHLDIRVPTVADPSLAPEGHHVLSILVHAVPHDLEGGWTEASRGELMKRVLARLASVSPSCADRIVGHEVLTPADLETEYRLTGGHLHHGEHGLDQLASLRPAASCAGYRTPLAGLFLCGSGSHPGGGITCAPGMLGAAAMV